MTVILRLLVLACFFALASRPAGATARVAYEFEGTCLDCTGTATAELVLQDYTQGAAIDATNFVRFTYAGTNLLPGYAITPPELGGISGSIPATPGGHALFAIRSSDLTRTFFTGTGGGWCTGAECRRDEGTAAVWSAAPRPIAEPVSFALVASGLIGLGLLLRRPA